MAPISPSSTSSPKRSSPSHSEDDTMEDPMSKRRRTELPTLPRTPPPDEPLELPAVSKARLFDDDPQQLLLRSLALALQHVGFEAATKEALTAFCAEVETYAMKFISQITTSMLNARRPEPTPLDFDFALKQFDLPLASIRPHLKPPIPASKSRVQLECMPLDESTAERDKNLLKLLGGDLNGEPDKLSKAYIPKKFIAFPSKHTYKWTEKESLRQTDPRKIREEAAKSARQAEEALRRLVNVSKAGKEKDVKLAASKDPASKERYELREQCLQAIKKVNGEVRADDDEDQSMIVNSESQFYRKGVPGRGKLSCA